MILVRVLCVNPRNAGAVRLGFTIGALVLLLALLMTGVLAGWLPEKHLGLLGLIPIIFGVYELFRPSDHTGCTDSNERKSGQTHIMVRIGNLNRLELLVDQDLPKTTTPDHEISRQSRCIVSHVMSRANP